MNDFFSLSAARLGFYPHRALAWAGDVRPSVTLMYADRVSWAASNFLHD